MTLLLDFLESLRFLNVNATATSPAVDEVIVVGGGLAGMSAATQVVELGGPQF